jgi:DnaJ-domain-containing protein 1
MVGLKGKKQKMTERWKKLADDWLGEVSRLGKAWPESLQQALGEYADSVMREAFDPEQFLEFLRRGGAGFSGFTGASNQTAADPYLILGLERTATDEEVKKRFHNLAHKLHPDTAGVEGTGLFFQLVKEAYEAIKRERGWR